MMLEAERLFERATFGLESKWLDLDGGERIHYHDIGSGPPILFLHGSGVGVSAAQNWSENLSALDGFRCIAYDESGFGHTIPPAEEELGFPAWTAQVVRVLDALHIDAAVLVGNSLGGRIALHTAIDYPTRVLGVFAMGVPALDVSNPNETPSARLAVDAVTPATIEAALRKMVHDQRAVTPDVVQSRFRMATGPGAAERFRNVIVARSRSMIAHPLDRDALARLTMPVLIGCGREDHLVPPRIGMELATIIPRADLHAFANCGHWPQAERPETFNATLRAFATQIYASSGATATVIQSEGSQSEP